MARRTDGEKDPHNRDDFWEKTGNVLVRHHVQPRRKLFYPTMSRMELPVDLSRLGSSRTIMKLYEDGEMHEERDRWDNKTPDVLCKTF